MILGILRLADFSELKIHLKNFGIVNLAIVCFLQVITMVLINIQWFTISKEIGQKMPIGKLIHINTISTFVESITPSVKAGGEAVKVYLLKSDLGFTTANAIALVTIQKIVSFFAFLVLSFISILLTINKIYYNEYFNYIIVVFVILLSIFAMVLFTVIFSNSTLRIIKRLSIKDSIKFKIEKGINQFNITFNLFTKNKKGLFFQIFFSIVIWSFYAIKSTIIANMLDLQLSVITISAFTFLSYMAGMIPLLPGGLGAFEGSMVFLLSIMQVPMVEGIAFTVILRFVTFWFVCIVSITYLAIYYLINIIDRKEFKKWLYKTT
ncbi:hypothetical protein EDD79_100954 [Serpentinicella alkaliphila]|uniref:Phosphatidylglycerol lysyltransferase n=2 Tax=Serpentinicella alkaliphila TaxID=1734049 RepID=A0A4V2T414_9FIRM|nr:hypothetical protein EDD79_100954 [Serpentinicella alkaliphila]